MKALGYYTYTGTQAVVDGQTIPLQNVVRQYGKNIRLGNNSVTLTNGCCDSAYSVVGYYNVSVNVTLTATAEGTETISLYQDGVLVPGAVQTVTTAADGIVHFSFTAPVRVVCGQTTSVLTIYANGGAGTMMNSSILVEKL